MVGAVADGAFPSYEKAADAVVRMERRFTPHPNAQYERKHRQYLLLYDAMLRAKRLD